MGLRLMTSAAAQHRAPALTSEADIRAAYDAHVGELYRFALRATGDQGFLAGHRAGHLPRRRVNLTTRAGPASSPPNSPAMPVNYPTGARSRRC